jgi:two-component system response regulator FlrC
VAEDAAMCALLEAAARAAATRATLLLTGPTGAGKDRLARHLHALSPRAAAPFVAVNCAALPEAMLESLLFGHLRGAFTGAAESAQGLFRAAEGGTLFLDEIGEMPLSLQAKLLRAVEQREVLPLGATQPVPVDVRLIAATHRDLAAEADAGRFRADLYWRLAVFPLALPALAARPADILPLAAALLRTLAPAPPPVSEAALAALLAHQWPGNVRELHNVLERALILSCGGPIDLAHIRLDSPATPPRLAERRRSAEQDAIRRALAETGGRREAARHLGISERALRYKLADLAGRPRGNASTAGMRLQ